ncbi:MAG TPA: hypothetical protein VGW39_05920 [Chthoniobacterales bacterium]|nr:hypothetical protein [Chthoniobacterales bacterium]
MIVLQFDSVYYHWGLLMVRSLALHEPRKQVLADTVNLSGPQQRELKRAHPQILVTSAAIAGNGSLRAEMARRKTMVLQRALDTFPDEPWFAMFNADMLVRCALSDLWSLLDGHQAALLMTNGVWEGRVYPHLFTPSGIVLVRRDGRELVDSWAKWDCHPGALQGHRPGEWFWDQCTLLQASEDSRVKCAAIPLHRFCSNRCSREAAIWSAHGRCKERSYRDFLIEYEVQRVIRTHPLLAGKFGGHG